MSNTYTSSSDNVRVRLSNNTFHIQQAQALYMSRFTWHFYLTLTFSWDIRAESARRRLLSYLRFIEDTKVKAPLSCLIAEETKESGLGQAAGRIHFHILVRCARRISVAAFQTLWEQSHFGGNRTAGPSAWVVPYNREISATYYLFKDLNKRFFEWSVRNLDLNAAVRPRSFSTSSRQRRRLRRDRARVEKGL